jgi:hypothetical protein
MRLLSMLLITILSCILGVAAQDTVPRYEIGPVFSTISLDRAITMRRSAIGGRFTLNFARWAAFDSDLTITPLDPQASTRIDGGLALQGQFGFKGGWRRNKFGIFGKARPGFISFSGAITNLVAPPPSLIFDYGRVTFFSFDAGGVFEFYPSRKISLRGDIGDTIIRYPTIATPAILGTIPAATTHNLQISTSIQYRF